MLTDGADPSGSSLVERALARAQQLVDSNPITGYRAPPDDVRLARYIEARHVGDLSVLALCLLGQRGERAGAG